MSIRGGWLALLSAIWAMECAAQTLPVPVPVPIAPAVQGLHSASQPQVARGNLTTVHTVWQDFRDNEWAIRYRRGTTSAAPLSLSYTGPDSKVSATPGPGVTIHSVDPRLFATGGMEAYVVWRAFDFNLHTERILFARTLNDGGLWNAPLAISADASYVSRPEISGDGGTHLVVVWVQRDPVSNKDLVYYTSSANKGAAGSWSAPQAINTELPKDLQSQPRVACKGRYAFVGYVDDGDPAGERVLVQRSSNYGVTFGAKQIVSATAGKMLMPAIAVAETGTSSHKVMVSWAENGTSVKSNWSTDSGANYQTAPVTVSTQAGTVLANELAGGTASRIYATYAFGSWTPPVPCPPPGIPATAQPTVVYANKHDTAWGPDAPVSAPGATLLDKGLYPLPHPQLSVENGNAIVTWMQSTAGYGEAFDVQVRWTVDGITWLPAAGALTITNKLTLAGDAEAKSAVPQVVLRSSVAVVVWDDRRHWTAPADLDPGTPIDQGIGAPTTYAVAVGVP